MSPAKAVIFDMDGVLIDSYRAHFESWRAVASERGLSVTEADFAAQFGRTSREVIAAWWGDRVESAEIARIDARKEELFRDIVAADFPVMPGAADLLDDLARAGFLLAVGSSGPPQNIEQALARLGEPGRFRAIVTGRDVTRGKPDPQVFQIAAARLGLARGRCVVVEDAPLGVAAAHAAGMAAVGLASTGRTRAELARAELVVDRLAELSPARFDVLIAQRA